MAAARASARARRDAATARWRSPPAGRADQPAAVQARLQRLVLDLELAARFFRREPAQVAQDDRLAIDRRQFRHRDAQRVAHLPPVHELVAEVGPVGRLQGARREVVERADRLVGHFVAARRPGRAQARHGGVEGDAVDPGREGGVAAEPVDLVPHLEQHVLHDFFGVFLVARVAQRQLEHLGAVGPGQLGHGAVVAGLQAFDECGIGVGACHGGLVWVSTGVNPGSRRLFPCPDR